MTVKRFFYLMIAVNVVLASIVVLTFYGINQFLGSQNQKLNDAKVASRVVEEQQAYLIQANKDLETYAQLEKDIKTIVPQDKDQAKTVREINNIARSVGIELETITFPSSTLGATPPPTAAAPAANMPAPAAPAVPAGLTQVAPAEGIAGVYALEINITSSTSGVDYNQLISFLKLLESNRRTAHVKEIILTPLIGSDRLTFNVTLNAYLKP